MTHSVKKVYIKCSQLFLEKTFTLNLLQNLGNNHPETAEFKNYPLEYAPRSPSSLVVIFNITHAMLTMKVTILLINILPTFLILFVVMY